MLLFGMTPIHRSRAILLLLALTPAARADGPATGNWAGSGPPLGVAHAGCEVADPAPVAPGGARFSLAGEHRRVLYPVFLPDPVPATPAGPAGSAAAFQVLFLFPGTEPVPLVVTTNL